MVETENLILIVIFAILVFFTFFAGIVVYTLCGQDPVVQDRVVSVGEGGFKSVRMINWIFLSSLLI